MHYRIFSGSTHSNDKIFVIALNSNFSFFHANHLSFYYHLKLNFTGDSTHGDTKQCIVTEIQLLLTRSTV